MLTKVVAMEIVMIADLKHAEKVSKRYTEKQSLKGVTLPMAVINEFKKDFVEAPAIAEVSPLSVISSDGHGKHSHAKASHRFQPYSVNRPGKASLIH